MVTSLSHQVSMATPEVSIPSHVAHVVICNGVRAASVETFITYLYTGKAQINEGDKSVQYLSLLFVHINLIN